MEDLDFLLHKNVGDGIEESVSQLRDIFERIEGAIKKFSSLLMRSDYCRDICPPLFPYLVEMYLEERAGSVAVEDLLLSLPSHCRPSALHTAALDSWIELWKRSCSCRGPNSVCLLSNARSLVANIILGVILKAEKGLLYKNKENFTLSMAGQVLSKFLIPESVNPIHMISESWLDSVIVICDIMNSLSSPDESDSPNVQANSEISLRMQSAVLLCQFVHFKSCSHRILKYLVNHPRLLSAASTKLLAIKECVPSQIPSADRSADFELEDYDIALFVLAQSLNPTVSPKFIPMLWSEDKQADVRQKASRCLNQSPFPSLSSLFI
jgi:hypothetical protein